MFFLFLLMFQELQPPIHEPTWKSLELLGKQWDQRKTSPHRDDITIDRRTVIVNEETSPSRQLQRYTDSIRDEHLTTVETYARTVTIVEEEYRWGLIQLLIERGRYRVASELILRELTAQEKANFNFWKWWEHTFGVRVNYLQMTFNLTEGLLHQYETGNTKTKETVARLLNRNEAEAKLSLEEFKKQISYDSLAEKSRLTEKQEAYLQGLSKLRRGPKHIRFRYYYDHLLHPDEGIATDAKSRFIATDPYAAINLAKENAMDGFIQVLNKRASKEADVQLRSQAFQKEVYQQANHHLIPELRLRLSKLSPDHSEISDRYWIMLAVAEHMNLYDSYRSLLHNEKVSVSVKAKVLPFFAAHDEDGAIALISHWFDKNRAVKKEIDITLLKSAHEMLSELKHKHKLTDQRYIELMSPLLQDLSIADLVINEMTRRKIWLMTDDVLKLAENRKLPSVVRYSILCHLYSCPHQQFPEAQMYVEKVRKEEPEFYQEAMSKLKAK